MRIKVAKWPSVLVMLMLTFAATGVFANTQLVLVEQDGCHYCEKWMAEIGDRYHLTEEARVAPLQRVLLAQTLPEGLPQTMSDISLTPTFVLLQDGEEIDRLVGYAGDNFFWGQLQNMLNKLPKREVD